MPNQLQYGLWGNCSNHCAFCLRKDRRQLTSDQMIHEIKETRKNLTIVDWKGQFSDGISLLGGELFHITDPLVQREFLFLIEDIIEQVLNVSPNAKFSCVTNGLYNTNFLYTVMDTIKKAVGMNRVDIHFSYDLKYRFKNEEDRQTVIKNILDFQKRYDHTVVVQMILTQHVIDLCKAGTWSPNYFMEKEIPGTILSFLYPHPIYDGSETPKTLPNFNFSRKDLLWFAQWLRNHNEACFNSFISSTYNSGIYKWTGRFDKGVDGLQEKPRLTDGKEILLPCGHSVLYRCYSDSDACLECDLENLD